MSEILDLLKYIENFDYFFLFDHEKRNLEENLSMFVTNFYFNNRIRSFRENIWTLISSLLKFLFNQKNESKI